MTIAACGDDRRGGPARRSPGSATLRDALRSRTGLALPELSMGMSGDFEAAIEEGATLVRVGSALFEGVDPMIDLTPHARGDDPAGPGPAGRPQERRRSASGPGRLRVAVTGRPRGGQGERGDRRRAWPTPSACRASQVGLALGRDRPRQAVPDRRGSTPATSATGSRPSARWPTPTERPVHPRICDTDRCPTIPPELTLDPLAGPPADARVRVPGSKSLTNRALIVAALADGREHA